MKIQEELNLECTFNITKHSILRHKERTDKGKYSKLSTVVRILELAMKDEKKLIDNLEKIIYVFNKWKNPKENFKHEGKCILLYEENKKIYKISCGININIEKSGINIIFTFSTFMNVWNNAINYISVLEKNKSEAIRKNMVISVETQNNEYNIYITPDK